MGSSTTSSTLWLPWGHTDNRACACMSPLGHPPAGVTKAGSPPHTSTRMLTVRTHHNDIKSFSVQWNPGTQIVGRLRIPCAKIRSEGSVRIVNRQISAPETPRPSSPTFHVPQRILTDGLRMTVFLLSVRTGPPAPPVTSDWGPFDGAAAGVTLSALSAVILDVTPGTRTTDTSAASAVGTTTGSEEGGAGSAWMRA